MKPSCVHPTEPLRGTRPGPSGHQATHQATQQACGLATHPTSLVLSSPIQVPAAAHHDLGQRRQSMWGHQAALCSPPWHRFRPHPVPARGVSAAPSRKHAANISTCRHFHPDSVSVRTRGAPSPPPARTPPSRTPPPHPHGPCDVLAFALRLECGLRLGGKAGGGGQKNYGDRND